MFKLYIGIYLNLNIVINPNYNLRQLGCNF